MGTTGKPLTDEERAIYEWQLWVRDYGEAGQETRKGSDLALIDWHLVMVRQ